MAGDRRESGRMKRGEEGWQEGTGSDDSCVKEKRGCRTYALRQADEVARETP